MSLEEDRLKALTYTRPEFIPVAVGVLPAAWMKYREDLDALAAQHPILFRPDLIGRRDYDQVGGTYVAGNHVDEWGCVWSNLHTGMEAIVTGHPVPTRQAVRQLKPPESVTARMPHGFMYLRLGDLRGFDEIMTDFAEEPPELQMLIDVVLAHNLRQLELRLQNERGPLLYFGDDLGMQDRLPISPKKWRRYLKPCFARLYGRCHDAGLVVYMHTDGHILEIIPDLIECGVDVINPQIRANGLEKLAAICKGKVCVDLDLDRQAFPFFTPAECDAHIREAVETLGSPDGGLWLKAEIGPDVPLENIAAICDGLEKYRAWFTK